MFEYLEPRLLLEKTAAWLRADGVLVVVLQQQTSDLASVTKTPYTSLKSLSSIMRHTDSQHFKRVAVSAGLAAVEEKTVTLATGKSFYLGTYRCLPAAVSA